MKKLTQALKLFLIFFKVGLFTFGGGYAMISMIENEFVSRKKLLSQEELLEIIAVAESTPGPIAINSATYIGYKKVGVLGSVFATLGVVLPSFIIIYIISLFLEQFMQLELVKKAFNGINCGVAVLIFSAGLKMFKGLKKTSLFIIIFILSATLMTLISIFKWDFSTIYMIVIGGTIGIITFLFREKKNRKDNNLINEKEKEK